MADPNEILFRMPLAKVPHCRHSQLVPFMMTWGFPLESSDKG
jgi:hypothetical protein